MADPIQEGIFRPDDSARWMETLDRIGRYDFCHLPAYNRLEASRLGADAYLLARQEGEHLIALPLLLRDVPESLSRRLGPGWKDVTSVYGYAGPIASEGTPPALAARFRDLMGRFFRDSRVVCAFSRLHPLLEEAPLLDGCGEVTLVGPTLSIDLTLSEEEQWRRYRRNHRQDITHLRARGVTCEEAGAEGLDDFIAIYHDTMDRVGASAEYYFGKRYFVQLVQDMRDHLHLFLCYKDGQAIAGGIFTHCRDIVQWFLSGSRSDYTGPPATKLVLDTARKWANGLGAKALHIGGGVGGNRDSLYDFKRGFTDQEYRYTLWRWVRERGLYEQLCEEARARGGCSPGDDFFPLYRHPAFEGKLGERAKSLDFR